MSVFGPAHPLDVDLADLVDGRLDAARAASVEQHVGDCLLCRSRRDRLDHAPPAASTAGRPLPSPHFAVPAVAAGGASPLVVGDLRLAGTDPRMLVVVVGVGGGAGGGWVRVAPVTFDVESADEQTLVVDAGQSPLTTGLAIHPHLAADVPAGALGDRMGSFGDESGLAEVLRGAAPGLAWGRAIVGASDPRLELRQHLAERLGSLVPRSPGPGRGAEVLRPRPTLLASPLIDDLRQLRGDICAVRPLADWGDVAAATDARWEPIATIDEVGIVLVVVDSPHGLTDDADFVVGRSVLTRFNATALVVLARGISDQAEVFDSSSLNHGIDAPSGHHTPPRPLISGLSPFDAIGKYLDQSTGARLAAPTARGPVARVDVADILREAAGAALAEAARQGARFKIAPKRRGYESVTDTEEPFAAALGEALSSGSGGSGSGASGSGGTGFAVQDLLDLAPRGGG